MFEIQILEPRKAPPQEVRGEVIRLLEAVRLSEAYYDRLPRQLSGGEKQRVSLARAFAGRPSLVLCDEPLSSLDVSVQADVLNLLLELQQMFDTTMLFISHDLSVVYQLCDEVAVMYLGQFCEIGPTEALFAPPYHPYTEALLSAVPVPDPTIERTTLRLSGSVPSALDPPTGCRFHTRCPRKIGKICETVTPSWREIAEGHRINCHIETEELRARGTGFQHALARAAGGGTCISSVHSCLNARRPQFGYKALDIADCFFQSLGNGFGVIIRRRFINQLLKLGGRQPSPVTGQLT